MPLRPYFEDHSITLYHGDAREILPQLEPETFDMALTDPPYLVSYSGRWGSDLEIIQGDSESSWVEPVFTEIWRLLKPDSLCFSFYGWPHAETFLSTWKTIGFRPVSLIAFIKDRWGLGQFTRAQHETAYLLAKGRPRKPNAAISDVLDWEQTSPHLHPNQKPLRAISKVVSTYTSEHCRILDPFCGSGTTLIAARNLGRSAVGIELEERYCEIVALRFSQDVFTFPATDVSPTQMPITFEAVEELTNP